MISILILFIPSTGAFTDIMDETLTIQIQPNYLSLKPDEVGRISMILTNIGDSNITIVVGYDLMMGGHTEVHIEKPVFQLGPNETTQKDISIVTNSNKMQASGASDVTIKLYWGINLLMDENDNVIINSTDGFWNHRIPISDDFSDENRFNLILVSAIIIIISISLLLIIKRHIQIVKENGSIHNS